MLDNDKDAGFTLLEMMVALVIAGFALSALFSGAATGLRSSQVSGDTIEALSLARSHLAAVGHMGPLVTSDQSGDDGLGFSWRLRIAPLVSIRLARTDVSSPQDSRTQQIMLFAVTVAESWSTGGATRRVVLRSQRIGDMAQAGP